MATDRGDQIRVDLAEGITVWLNSRSEITYLASFTGRNRVVELKGEAYISLSENADPFVVKSYDSEIVCTNGSFNIENDSLLHATEVEVSSGWVILKNSGGDNRQLIVEEGCRGIMNDYLPGWIENNSDPNYLAWHTRKMAFSETPLQKVAETLMEVYDVDISIPDETRYCTISNNFNNQELNTVLSEIESLFKLKIERNDHSIIITGNPC
ncbi:MAG: FecR family protein [Bacteroidales bacterium]|nr:FecR family protein [Bacteroidales bacterium]